MSTTTVRVGEAQMPAVGLGLWKLERETAAATVHDAIAKGYRHLDSATDYGNEVEVGQGIASALSAGLCTREELWLTSKLWNTDHAAAHVEPALKRTLKDLQVDYLDLYLIHFPIALAHVPHDVRYPPEWLHDPEQPEQGMRLAPVPLAETWGAMEGLVKDGLVRHIGVCNYNSGLIHDLLSYASIKPAVLQIESHPYLTQERLLRLCNDRDIAVTAFSPLGALSYVELDMAGQSDTVLTNEAVLAAASRTGRTPAQVVLRWGVQRGTAIIPKTSKPERLVENLALFDFELSAEEMDAISALNANRRFNDPAHFCEAAFNTFHPIYD
jgi:D-xylose reductase